MAYKFQSGDATLSGSVTLVTYQDLLFETDAASNIGTAAKAVGITFTDRLTASVAVSASAVYADNFYGNGSGLSGISSDTVDTTTDTTDGTYYIPFVDQATGATGETLRIASALSLNPSNGDITAAGRVDAGSNISSSAALQGASLAADGAAVLGGAVTAASFKTTDVTYGDAGITMDSDGGHFTIEQDDADKSVRVVLGATDAGTSGFAVRKASGAQAFGVIDNGVISGSGALTAASFAADGTAVVGSLTAGDLTDNRLPLVGSSGLLQDNAAFTYIDSRAALQGYLGLAVSSSASGSAYVGDGMLAVTAGPSGAELITVTATSADFGVGVYVSGLLSGSGNLTIAGNSTFQGELLPLSDNTSDLGSSTQEWKDLYLDGVAYIDQVGTAVNRGTVFATTVSASANSTFVQVTASVGLSGSTIYANKYYGNGSGLSGISADDIDVVAGSVSAVSPIIFSAAGSVGASGVQPLGLATFGFNPATGKFQVPGVISGSGALQGASLDVGGGQVAGTTLSIVGAAVAATLSGSGLVSGGSANFAAVLTAGDLSDGAGGSLSGGVLTGSSITMDTTIQAAANKFQVADNGNLTAVGGSFSGALSGSSTLSIAGNVQLDGADDGVAFVVADSMYFRDAGSGLMRRDSWADVMSAAAGDGITATAGVLSVSSTQNIDVDTIGNASRQLTSAGMNYATASLSANRTFTLPASPDTGDLVYLKFASMGGNHAVISGSGMQLIDGVSTLTASSDFAGISLCYVASDVWRIF